MKKLLIILCVGAMIFSCSKDDCEQEALCTLVSGVRTTNEDKVWVCHNGSDLEISVNALQAHLDHGDTEGKCETLSDGGLTFADGKIVEISCNYELPFIHVKDNGEQWMYSDPN